MRYLFVLLLFCHSNSFFAQSLSKADALLFEGVIANNQEMVDNAIKLGANINVARDTNLGTPVLWAAFHSGLPMVKHLIEAHQADYQQEGTIRDTLPWPTLNGLGKDTMIKAPTYLGNLVCIAAGTGQLDLLKYVIDTLNLAIDQQAYFPPNPTNGWRPLQAAGQFKKWACETFLLERGAKSYTGKEAIELGLWYKKKNSEDFVRTVELYFKMLNAIDTEFPKDKIVDKLIDYLFNNAYNCQDEITNKEFYTYWYQLEKYLLDKYPDNHKFLRYFYYFQAKNIRHWDKKMKAQEQLVYYDSLYRTQLIVDSVNTLKWIPSIDSYIIGDSLQLLAEQKKYCELENYYYTNQKRYYASAKGSVEFFHFWQVVHTSFYNLNSPIANQATDSISFYEKILNEGNQEPVNAPFSVKASSFLIKWELDSALYYSKKELQECKKIAIDSTDNSLKNLFYYKLYVFRKIYLSYILMFKQECVAAYENLQTIEREIAKSGKGNEQELQIELAAAQATFAMICTEDRAKRNFYQQKKLEGFIQLNGKEHPQYPSQLIDIALNIIDAADYSKAYNLFQQIEQIQLENIGEIHEDYLDVTTNLGFTATKMKQYELAQKHFQDALVILSKIENSACLTTFNFPNLVERLYNDMSNFYLETNQIDSALFYYQKAYIGKNNKMKRLSGRDSWIKIRGALLPIWAKENGKITSEEQNIIAQALDKIRLEWKQKGLISTAQEKAHQVNYSDKELSSFLIASALSLDQDSEQLTDLTINYLLLRKSQALKNDLILKKVLKEVKDPLISTQIKRLEELDNALSFTKNETLAIERDNLSRDIQLALKDYPSYQQLIAQYDVTWETVQQKLGAEECFIDFVRYRSFDKGWQDTMSYAAVVIPPTGKPKIIPLFFEAQLQDLLTTIPPETELGNYQNALDLLYKRKDLYEFIWQPLLPMIKDKKRLIVSTDGLLNQLSLSAILAPKNDGQPMFVDYQIKQITSIQSIITKKPVTSFKDIVLFGNVDFDTSSLNLNPTTLALRGDPHNDTSPLPTPELQNIIETCTPFLKVTSYQQDVASEKVFRTLDKNSPDIISLHLHAIAFNKQADSENKQAIDQAMRNAYIALSGINNYKKDSLTWQIAKNDGKLTALEIENLDLSNNKLLVTAACKTALGKTLDAEGVFGLQRAFKVAGVQYQLNTLWSVSSGTPEFMIQFYENLITKKLSIEAAYRQTQIWMYNNAAHQEHPYNWAGFILVE